MTRRLSLACSGLLFAVSLAATASASDTDSASETSIVSVVADASAAAARTGSTSQPAIYGHDSRQEYFATNNSSTANTAKLSAVSLISGYQLVYSSRDTIRVRSGQQTLSKAVQLCSDEAFGNQPTAAFCSGVLIGPDLVLTAGHCVWDAENQCPSLRFAFRYVSVGTGESGSIVDMREDDVYACKNVITRQQSSGTAGMKDWAVVQLDRPVSGDAKVASIRTARTALPVDARLLMVGSPSGLPMKVDEGGKVRNNRADRLDAFVATVDAFGGNSGSGVWDHKTGELAGILVSGDTDYKADGNCRRVNRCSETGCSGENVIYIHNIIDDFCKVATSETLCNTPPRAGDGFCAYNETGVDCSPVVAGDGFCHGSEFEGAPDDCFYNIPAAWTCEPHKYGSYDGCNNNCGAPDPDCKLKSADSGLGDLFNCQSASGVAAGSAVFAALSALLVLGGWRRRRASLSA